MNFRPDPPLARYILDFLVGNNKKNIIRYYSRDIPPCNTFINGFSHCLIGRTIEASMRVHLHQSSQLPRLQSNADGGAAIMDVQLGINAFQKRMHRVRADPQFVGNFFVEHPFGDQS